MGSVGRGENMAIFKLQEIGKKESAVVVSPDRLQLAEKENGFLERVAVRVAEEKGVVFCGREEEKAAEGCGEGECGGGESRSSSTGREGKWVSREGCCEGCRGEGCGFFADEKKIRQPKGVEKKRRQKEKGVDVAWCRREEEKEEDKGSDEKIRFLEG
ncbi:hypothetical protein OIU78_002473 [Salix suchowensis]|nr:hypothetical protein OIU78_002473 [Salix suchowensis]